MKCENNYKFVRNFRINKILVQEFRLQENVTNL